MRSMVVGQLRRRTTDSRAQRSVLKALRPPPTSLREATSPSLRSGEERYSFTTSRRLTKTLGVSLRRPARTATAGARIFADRRFS
jgi:hypothetical protein